MRRVEDKTAVCLLSGGMDSATVMALAAERGYGCHALCFAYGQRNRWEVVAARELARRMGAVGFRCVDLDPACFAGSALTDRSIDVPGSGDRRGGVPVTYVPARNLIFLSYAVAWAEVLGCFDVFVGVNCADYSGYPDCRPQFIAAFEKVANLATAAAVEGGGRYRVHAPIIDMSKARIILAGTKLGVDYSLTRSCYDPGADGKSCGRCDSCRLRLKGFAEASLRDPIEYQNS
jgi:7-cyano-7-deazaguanine synthase